MILSPISSIALSHETRVHWPLTSLSGYLSRRSECTSSRTDAPLAQCEPRLNGLSQLGSWPIHTSFCTSAVTVQPTEQCVQMFLRVATGVPARGDEARAAQERAAVEPAARLAGQRGRQLAAVRFAFLPFDQHGLVSLTAD